MWPRPFLRERTYPLESPSNKLSLTLSSSLVNLFLLLLYFACAVFKDLAVPAGSSAVSPEGFYSPILAAKLAASFGSPEL